MNAEVNVHWFMALVQKQYPRGFEYKVFDTFGLPVPSFDARPHVWTDITVVDDALLYPEVTWVATRTEYVYGIGIYPLDAEKDEPVLSFVVPLFGDEMEVLVGETVSLRAEEDEDEGDD